MRVTFYGAAESVTGSKHLLEINGRKILLDCGLHQGHRQESEELNRNLPFDPSELDAIILSHAHIDHSGNLPGAVKNGFGGMIVSTFATRDLAAIMLPDSAHIQKYDTEYLNRKRERKGLPPLEPLYDAEDVTETLKHFMSIPYDRDFPLFPDITLRFIEAGHILGSSQVQLRFRERGKEKTLLFSGDLGRPGRPILKDPDESASCDVLIMESTYGGRNHEEQEKALGRFGKIVNRTFKAGGKLIIPAFSVGRTQEVLYYINELISREEMPSMRVYVDSPLSFDATEVYKIHQECFDKKMIDYLYSNRSPFQFEGLHFTQGVADSKALNHDSSPMVIISASGMCENGRILHHLKNNIEDEASTVLIVGFMAQHTLGRRLLEGESSVRIFGEEYAVNAGVEVINGFSAHADSDALVDYAKKVGGSADSIFLVHGEPDQSRILADRITERTGEEPVIPSMGYSCQV
ncbi:MAG: MBL fold metallo-hydrolase [Candidatus Aegiribacteria sp.]|nr:MBL fold metallo-hydrolase [Candidatus Aegiribacteria sp.]MBD3294076.1 MBL fold metallo-hydrolase [Candidatus Fermentibacteria bacterium]